jgi:hypothetical protein
VSAARAVLAVLLLLACRAGTSLPPAVLPVLTVAGFVGVLVVAVRSPTGSPAGPAGRTAAPSRAAPEVPGERA